MTRLWVLLSALLPIVAFGFQQRPAGFTISGTVVEHGTNRPWGGVLVIVSPTAARDQQLTVVTGGNGRFAFTNLPAAKYSLLAQRHGEREIYGYRGTEGFSTGIVTGPEMNSENLVFPLDAPPRYPAPWRMKKASRCARRMSRCSENLSPWAEMK